MKKFLSIVLAFSFIFVITACGAKSFNSAEESSSLNYAQSSADSAVAAPSESSPEKGFGMVNNQASESKSSLPQLQDRKLVKHSNMELQTKEFDTAIEEVLSTITSLGGYVEYQEISGNNLYTDKYNKRYAAINARIPVNNLEKVQNEISQFCNVLSQSSNIEDITDSYFDTDARLKSCKLKEERLLDLLKKADTMKDIIEIEQSLSDVRFQIESLTSAMQRMDSQISYSYLNMNIDEVIEYDVNEDTFIQRITASFKRSGKNIANWFESALTFAIEQLPVLILNLAILAIIVYVVFLVYKKSNLIKKLRNKNVSNSFDNKEIKKD